MCLFSSAVVIFVFVVVAVAVAAVFGFDFGCGGGICVVSLLCFSHVLLRSGKVSALVFGIVPSFVLFHLYLRDLSASEWSLV